MVKAKAHKLDGQVIHVQSATTNYKDIVLEKKVNGWTFGNFLTGGVVGWGVDLITNCVSKPSDSHFFINADGTTVAVPQKVDDTATSPEKLSRHEFRLGIGFAADGHLRHENNAYVSRFGLDKDSPTDAAPSRAAAYLEYFYHLSRHFAIGGSFGLGVAYGDGGIIPGDEIYDYQKQMDAGQSPDPIVRNVDGKTYQLYPIKGRLGDEHVSEPEAHTFFFMPTAKYTWLIRRHVDLYSKVGLGLRHYRFDITSDVGLPEVRERRWKVCSQVTLIGVEVGGKHFRYFAEIAPIGEQGCFNMGLAYRL